MDTERPKSSWCHRGHFAVAAFLHRGVFRSAQRQEWHVEADKKTLRHMTRGKVLRVDAELHDGQRLQVFNVHQATSGDIQSNNTHGKCWPRASWNVHISAFSSAGNANANGLRVGYAVSNTEHMKRVDELLTKFVHDTTRELMSPSTVSWKRGDKGARLDHIIPLDHG
jgi:hypothetical protein